MLAWRAYFHFYHWLFIKRLGRLIKQRISWKLAHNTSWERIKSFHQIIWRGVYTLSCQETRRKKTPQQVNEIKRYGDLTTSQLICAVYRDKRKSHFKSQNTYVSCDVSLPEYKIKNTFKLTFSLINPVASPTTNNSHRLLIVISKKKKTIIREN